MKCQPVRTAVLSLVAGFLMSGCRFELQHEPRSSTVDWVGSPRLREAHGLRTPGEPWPELSRLFQIMTAPGCDRAAFERALKGVCSLPVTEPPSLWVAAVNDPDSAPWKRRAFVQALFQRHLRPGTPVAEISSILGRTDWFTRESIRVVGAHTGLPVHEIGEVACVLRLPFMREEGSAVSVRIAPEITTSQLLQLLNGEDQDRRYQIRGVQSWDPIIRHGGGLP